MTCVDNYTLPHASVQTVQLRDQKSLALVKTNIKLDSHADVCFVGDQSLSVHGYNRPMNDFGYNPKKDSKHV